MSAEMLSKMYWSKLGLLGFLEMMPRIVTKRCKSASTPSARWWRAVMMTRATPVGGAC
jgi:hypothetical protein